MTTRRLSRSGTERITDYTVRTERARCDVLADAVRKSRAVVEQLTAEVERAQHRNSEDMQSLRNSLVHARADLRRVEQEHESATQNFGEYMRQIDHIGRTVAKPTKFYGGGSAVRTPAQNRVVLERAADALSSIPSWVPRRICDEEIGDALEEIHRFAREARPGWQKQVARKVRSTRFWVMIHAIREIVSSVLGRRST